MNPDLLYPFAPEFEANMRRLLAGWKSPNVVAGKSIKLPSEKQIVWLKKFNKEIPATMAEATAILNVCFGRG